MQDGDFLKLLVKKPALNYDSLLPRAEKYINIKEVRKYNKGDIREKASK